MAAFANSSTLQSNDSCLIRITVCSSTSDTTFISDRTNVIWSSNFILEQDIPKTQYLTSYPLAASGRPQTTLPGTRPHWSRYWKQLPILTRSMNSVRWREHVRHRCASAILVAKIDFRTRAGFQ